MNIVQHRLLNPAEVAVELRVSAPTVYRLVKSGELRAVKVGGQLRVAQADVDRLLAGNEPDGK
jgi:excisionase family DNA binding protein